MSKKKTPKTNVARLLDTAQIPYRLQTYDVDLEDLSATHTAEVLGITPEIIYKTIVMEGDKTGPIVCIIPAGHEVDLKHAARVSGNKSVHPLPMKDLQRTTGYVRGGCSPIGMKKAFPTILDRSALTHEEIYISAGMRGVQVIISPHDLSQYISAEEAEIATPSDINT